MAPASIAGIRDRLARSLIPEIWRGAATRHRQALPKPTRPATDPGRLRHLARPRGMRHAEGPQTPAEPGGQRSDAEFVKHRERGQQLLRMWADGRSRCRLQGIDTESGTSSLTIKAVGNEITAMLSSLHFCPDPVYQIKSRFKSLVSYNFTLRPVNQRRGSSF